MAQSASIESTRTFHHPGTANCPATTPNRYRQFSPELEQTRAAWDNIAAGYSEFVTPSHIALASEGLRRVGLRPGMRLLDVAAGSGALSLPAARQGARVVAADLSPGMLDLLSARARAEALDIETHVMDGHALAFADDTFDVSASQFGVMLFPDMPRGVRELARVTRAGGRVLMNVYGDPRHIEFFGLLVGALHAAVPGFAGPPMDPPPLPFQLQDPQRLRDELAKAGLHDVQVDAITERLGFRSGTHLWNWLTNSNPIVGTLLAELALTSSEIATVRNALDDKVSEVRERAGAGNAAILTNPVHIGIGTK